MSFTHRKLLFLPGFDVNVTSHVVVMVNKLDCLSCQDNCPDECKTSTEDYFIPAPPAPSHNSQMSLVLILVLCVLSAAFIFLCYLTILRRYRASLSNSRRRNPAPAEANREDFIDENHGPEVIHHIWYINTVGLDQSVIDSIAVFKYKKGDGLIEGSDCSVCLSEFEEDETLRLLPKCSHAFHISCIDTWLRSHKNCPSCRAPIVGNTNIDPVEVNTVEVVVTNSASGVENPVEGHQESNQRLNRAHETISPSTNEEGKMVQVVNRAPCGATRKGTNRVLSDLANNRVAVDQELQPIRRSISIDLATASNIYASTAKIRHAGDEGALHVEEEELKRQNPDHKASKEGEENGLIIHRPRHSLSFSLSLQKVPIRMKRSISSSGKLLSQPRYSRSQEN